VRWFAELIDAFARADGPPPDRLGRFLAWALRGAFPAIWLALAVSIGVGITEVGAAWVVGWLIDFAQGQGPEALFAGSWPWLVAAAVFFLVVRPGMMGLGAAFNALTLGPNLYPLVLSRLNRHTLGQSLSFFDEDFAGRIAQKQQQTARAITDVVSETVQTLGLAVTAILGAMVLVGVVNPWLALGMGLWLMGYAWLIRHYLPQIRLRSKDRAAARAVVTGQVVDTITNIATVKLFSHGMHEDQAALRALEGYRGTTIRFGAVTTAFRLADDAGRRLAGDADRRDAVVLEPRVASARRHRHGGADRDAHRADVGLGQHDGDGHLLEHRRDRGRDAHAVAAAHDHRRLGTRSSPPAPAGRWISSMWSSATGARARR
jgi:ATP-binding cassette, subfamily B, bacterial